MKQETIRTFIRDDKGQPRGIAVAIRKPEGLQYGYSLLNTRLDRFNKDLGIKIATARANSVKGYGLPLVPEREQLVIEAFVRLQERALRYFKDMNPDDITVFELLDKEYDVLNPST